MATQGGGEGGGAFKSFAAQVMMPEDRRAAVNVGEDSADSWASNFSEAERSESQVLPVCLSNWISFLSVCLSIFVLLSICLIHIFVHLSVCLSDLSVLSVVLLSNLSARVELSQSQSDIEYQHN